MEVVDVMVNEGGASVAKTIRLLVPSNGSDSVKFRKIEDGGNEEATSIFLCTPGDSLLQNPTLLVPVSGKKNSPLKMNVTSSLKVSSVLSHTQKKHQKGPVITILQARSPSSSSTSDVQFAKTALPNILRFKTKQGTSSDPSLVRLQSAYGTQKTSLTSDIQERIPCTSIFEEQLPLLTEVSEKSPAQSCSSGSSCQTVMMRVNNYGETELELDPLFLNAEVLTESEVAESPSDKKEQFIVAEIVEEDSQPAKIQGEGGNANVNQNWFTSREDKELLKWRGHEWRQGMWSKEETELLQKNIMDYCTERNLTDPGRVIFKMSKEERNGFYRIIAKGLNRPLFSIYRRVIRMYDDRNHIGKYSTEEVNKLRELRMKHGNNWQAIAAHLGRSAASVKDRCRLLNENCNRGAWTVEEEDRLAVAVYDLARVIPGEQVSTGISWGEVAARVKTRSEKQCRTKWLNYLNWKRTSGVVWGKADDIQLICRLSVCGVDEESQVDWSALAQGWPACRSPHWLRGKWWNLKKRLHYSCEDKSLRELCQKLYNMQTLNLLQSTLIELPTTGLGPSSVVTLPSSGDDKSESGDDSLSSGGVRLCIPAANFASILNSDNKDEDFASKLNSLVQTAVVVPSTVNCSDQPVTALISQSNSFSSSSLSSHLSSLPTQLTSALAGCPKAHAIVVENLEDSMIHLPEVTNGVVGRHDLLNRVIVGLERGVKEEHMLSDGEETNAQTGLSAGLDPSSPAVTSQVILNDPILSVSGEPLGHEEGLQQDHDGTDIVIV